MENASAAIATANAVRHLQAGNAPQARELLARRAARLSLGTAAALTASREQADEVSQDVAIEVLRSLDSLRDPAAFDGWVHRITVRRAKKLLRRNAHRRRQELPLALQSIEAESRSAAVDELVALRAALGAALAQLPDRQRLAIALRYVQDLSDEQIAEVLECRVGTVHALLSRARSSLRTSDELALFAPRKKEVCDAASIDLFGERVDDPAVAEKVLDDYISLATALPPAPADVWLSVDLSHLALGIDPSGAADRLALIARSLPPGRRVQVGAEEAALTDAVLACVLDVAAPRHG